MNGFDFIRFNKNFSWYFFLFSILLLLAANYLNFELSNLVCLILILLFGITHGSLDNLKGKKLFKIFKIKNEIIFYISYIALAIVVILLWLMLPSFMLFVFLIVASYHFGKEDTSYNFGPFFKFTKKFHLFFLFKGSIIIVAPLIFHYEQSVEIFSNLFLKESIFFNILEIMKYKELGNTSLSILNLLIILSILAGIGLHGNPSTLFTGNLVSGTLIPDTVSILLLNYYLSPLVAFTIYFCFLHSPRHSLSLIDDLGEKNFSKGLQKFLKKALPLTLVTAILFILGVYVLVNYYVLDDAILKVIFIGLASLTFPHILLEYLIEKNEK
jgi:beta-carotene 15,15'-dioxygenase